MDHGQGVRDDTPMGSRAGWSKIFAAVASGVMVALAFPSIDLPAVVWVGLMPLLVALWSLNGGRVGWKGFGLGYLAGLASGLIQCQWVGSVSWLGALALPAYLAVYWGLFGLFAAKFGNPWSARNPRGTLITAICTGAVWAGTELLRGWVITGFSWNVLGVAVGEIQVLAQAADLLGVVGLSMVVVFFQAVVVQVLKNRGWQYFAMAAGTIGLLAAYGTLRIYLENNRESLRLKTLLVQLNVPMEASRMLWTDVEMHQAYEEETLKGLQAAKPFPDWVMWPETALTGRILRAEDGTWGTWQINQDTLAQVRTGGDFTLIYGINELEAEKFGDQLVMKPNGRSYNSIAAMSPKDDLQTYRKRHLVIFGETIPLVDTFPLLKRIYEQQAGAEYGGSFSAGDSLEPLRLKVGEHTIGAIPTVCFEDSVPRLTRKFVRPGPQVIINVTNDGWFKQSAAADQHFRYARFRAIELRRPMLRCANTGVSAAIDTIGSTRHPDHGRSQILTDENGSHFTRGSLLVELDVPLEPSFSLYAVIGDWGLIGISMAAVWIGSSRRKK